MNTKFSNYLLYAFAVIGFISILSSFNNQPQQETHGTPESHVWEILSVTGEGDGVALMYNKVTGDVRKLNYKAYIETSDLKREQIFQYVTMSEALVQK